jgi:hypothetical protein
MIFVEAVGRHILMVMEEQHVRISMGLCQYKMPLFQYEDLYYLPMLIRCCDSGRRVLYRHQTTTVFTFFSLALFW